VYVSCLYELSCSALSHFACFPSSSLHFDRCAFTTAFSSALFVLICDIFVNCNWVATQWQYSTHLHTNSTQKDTKILEQCWTFTHKQYTEGQNNFGTVLDIYTQTVHRTIQKFWNSAGHLHTNSTQKDTKILEQCWTFTHKQYTERYKNSGTVLDIYTQTVHRRTQNKQYTEQHKHFGTVLAMPRVCELYPGICLTAEEKARKNLSEGSRRLPTCAMNIHKHTITIHRHNNKNT